MTIIPTSPAGHRLTRVALLALTSGVAAVTFAISFHGLDGYGQRLMHLGDMSPLVPVGVDLASLVALLAAHLRRGERLSRRAYTAAVFAATAALSIAGNLADGRARGLPAAGLVGVAMAPVVFALVSHLAISSWRGTAAEVAAEAPAEAPTPRAARTAQPRTAPKRSFADTRRAAAALAADGAGVADVARILGVTDRQARAALRPVPINT